MSREAGSGLLEVLGRLKSKAGTSQLVPGPRKSRRQCASQGQRAAQAGEPHGESVIGELQAPAGLLSKKGFGDFCGDQ